MTLKEFMKQASLTDAELAQKLGCSQGAVRKWRYGERIPRQDQLRQIHEITNGAVTANDFVGSTTPDAERPAA